MKKSLIALFLVTVMTLPLLAADKGTREINIKAGLNINPQATADIDELVSSLGAPIPLSLDGGLVLDGDMQYRLGAEGYYFVKNNLGCGIGLERAFPTDYINGLLARIDSVNIYAAAKQEFKISENQIMDSFYFLGRLGFGINKFSSDAAELVGAFSSGQVVVDLSMDNGLYWALGVGVEKNNFFVELLYSVNYSKLKAKVSVQEEDPYTHEFYYDTTTVSTSFSLSTIGINVGYKFNI